MKLDFLQSLSGQPHPRTARGWRVAGETQRLTDVLLSAPSHLEPVPCCAVTRDSIAAGFRTDTNVALDQHRMLRETLSGLGVRCHSLPAIPGMPDLCFTRDAAVTTPWGPVVLNPALSHRQREADHLAAYLDSIGAVPVLRIRDGTIEGGDVCVARDGLAIIGQSGERTNAAGVAALSQLFDRHGWEVLVSRFDPRHLHLDTIFCMLDADHALACVEALDAAFLNAVTARGIGLLSVSMVEAHGLGGNILSIDGRTILVNEDQPRIRTMLAAAGFDPVPLAISQFAACGGGLHCLTMPLARG